MSELNRMVLSASHEKMPAKEINLGSIYTVLKRRVLTIVIVVVMFTGMGGYLNSLPETPIYQASAKIVLYADLEMTGVLNVLFKEPEVLNGVIEELGLKKSYRVLGNQINIISIRDTRVMQISAIDPDPVMAARIVNTTIDEFKRAASSVLNFTGVQLLTPAEENPNAYPINPKSNRMMVFGFVAGLVAAIGLAFLRESLDESLRTVKEVETLLELPVIGTVSAIGRKEMATKSSKEYSVSVRGETIGS